MPRPSSFGFHGFSSFGAHCFGGFTPRLCLPFFSVMLLTLCGFSIAACAASPSGGIFTKGQALSPEAQRLYHYLVLSDATIEGDSPSAVRALKSLIRLDSSRELYRDAGTILLNWKNYGETKKVAADGLKKYPGDAILTLILATAHSETGETQAAIQLLTRFVDSYKPTMVKSKNAAAPAGTNATQGTGNEKSLQEYAAVVNELVRLHLKENNLQKAGELLPRLPAAENPQTMYLQARILQSTGKLEEAKKVLQDLSKVTPEDPEVWIDLGYLAEKRQKPDEAVQAYSTAYSLAPEAQELFFRIIMLHIDAKEPQKAVEFIKQRGETPTSIIQAALLLSERGLHEQARQVLEFAKTAGAKADEVAMALSIVYLNDGGNTEKALEMLTPITPENPLYEEALERRTRFYLVAKQFAKAAALAREGQNAFKENTIFWELEAYASMGEKRPEDARKTLGTALTTFPGNEDLLYALATVEDEVGNTKKAMRLMEDVIAKNPRNPRALNYVGYTLAEAGKDLPRALKLLTVAVQEDPGAWQILDSLAWAQYRLGHYKEAWISIRQSIDLGADEPTIWEHYGDIARALKKKEEAIKGYDEALKRSPDNAVEVRKKRDALNK